MARKPRFELHILPMFRILDRDHMLESMNLFNYQVVRDHFTSILGWISGAMPPETHGGPWPEEWVALFERWGKEKFPKLESSKGSYTAQRDGEIVSLVATGNLLNRKDSVWLQRINEDVAPRKYMLYREPSDTASTPGTFTTEAEIFRAVPGENTIVVYDENGEHTVQITPG